MCPIGTLPSDSRTLAKSAIIADIFPEDFDIVSFEKIPDDFNVIINATTVSLVDLMPSLPVNLFSRAEYYYDLSYGGSALDSMEYVRSCGVEKCAAAAG